MSQPLTEEQRQKLLQLRQQQSGFNAGVDTTFDPQEIEQMNENVPATPSAEATLLSLMMWRM
jgi:hypothetical protein